jgi:hypothetical protein
LGDWLYLQGGTIGIGVQITNYARTISGDDPSSGGNTEFEESASAGNAVIYNNAAEANDTASGKTTFNSQSTAGAALVTNFGATGDYGSGYTVFKNTSTAASAGIINEAGPPRALTAVPRISRIRPAWVAPGSLTTAPVWVRARVFTAV